MSSSLTSRLSLYKADPGTGEPVDVTKINANMDKIDAAIGPADVTSTTRPATPYPNQFIRESDTRRLYVWNATNTSWDEIQMPVNGITNGGNNTWTGLNSFNATATFNGSVAVGGTLSVNSGVAFPHATMRPTESEDNTALTGITSLTAIAGSPQVGHTFVAPPSGAVMVNVSGYIACASAASQVILSFEMRAGGTVGSGTVFYAANPDRGLRIGRSASDELTATRRNRVFGLTPGSTYNVRTMHWMGTGTGGQVLFRNILVEPLL